MSFITELKESLEVTENTHMGANAEEKPQGGKIEVQLVSAGEHTQVCQLAQRDFCNKRFMSASPPCANISHAVHFFGLPRAADVAPADQ